MFDDKNLAESRINELVEILLGESYKNSKDGKCDYSEDSFHSLKKLRQVLPTWEIEFLPMGAGEVDRKANMFGGTPFTSKKYPWPLNSKGKPCYPLSQINLGQISEITGRNFGDGLMQVWLDITKNDLDNFIRIINIDDLNDPLEKDAPEASLVKKIDKSEIWFGSCSTFSLKFKGYMMAHWFDGALEWDYGRDLSDQEVEALNALENLSEENGYRSMSGGWLLGYPDRRSGTPAGRYFPEPRNFIQFSDSRAFPMVDVSRYANIFFSDDDGDVSYFFDWNG